MIVVVAHPDDESFMAGGSLSKYARAGWQIDVVCATRGENGSSGPVTVESKEELARVRSQEMQKACSLLGVSSLVFLDYKDGKLKALHPGELEDKLQKIFIETAPDIVVTFEPNGVSNHPDHCKISLACTYAFQEYIAYINEVKINQINELNRPSHPREQWKVAFADLVRQSDEPKLYFAVMPESIADYYIKHKIVPEISFDKPWRGIPDKLVTTVIDIEEFMESKARALNAHVTQMQDVERFYSAPNPILMKQEYFVLRYQGKYEIFMGKTDRVSDEL